MGQPSLPKWRPRRTVIDLYSEKDQTLWYWRVAATLSAFLIMIGYVLALNPRLGTQFDRLQLPHIPLRLQAEWLSHYQLEIRNCRCHHPPRLWLRPLSRHLPHLPLLDISARYYLRTLPILLRPRPHQHSLYPLHTREVPTVDILISSRSRSLYNLDHRLYYRCPPHFPEDPYCKSEGCDASTPFRLNGCYDAGIRATATTVTTAFTPA